MKPISTILRAREEKGKEKVSKNNPIFDRRIEIATEGLLPYFSRTLYHKLPYENALTIANYIISMKTEINPSLNYRKENIRVLCQLSKYCNHKPFKSLTRENILEFLDSFRKPEASDPLHNWIGTYNLFRIYMIRFFKWLYNPDIELGKRSKPSVIENIPQLKRKEQSIYKPTDLWTAENDLIFLKYCPSKRIKCYHVMAKDTSCRPHEILKLRIKDVQFKTAGNHQYAEVQVNGKTGSRPLLLIHSIPYVKDYLDHEHPQPGNPNAILIAGNGKSLGRPIGVLSLEQIYARYKEGLFQRLLGSPNVSPEDKKKMTELLKKPWNPYILRHSALTEKSTILKEHVLRQHAGWSIGSHMPQRYLHYFGNESNTSLLEEYGIMPKDRQSDQLKSKQCPNCNEPNKPDSKFCAKCRMVLTYDAYSETIDDKQQKDDALATLSDQVMKLMAEVQELKNQK
ncbi:MAG TPA: site-specific integrase [Nitrososphaeraceae archaeon]